MVKIVTVENPVEGVGTFYSLISEASEYLNAVSCSPEELVTLGCIPAHQGDGSNCAGVKDSVRGEVPKAFIRLKNRAETAVQEMVDLVPRKMEVGK